MSLSRFVLFVMLFAVFIPVRAMAQQSPVPVYVTIAETRFFADEIEALGTLKANENVNLTSSVTERITAIYFDSGARVNQGDVLIEMDAAQEKALLEEAKSVLAEAQKQVERLTPLVKQGATSESAMDTAQLNLQTAKARVAAIESQISERIVTAPFDGKLGLRNVSVGSMAQPGTLITTLDDDTVMKLDFSIPEVYLPALREGGKVTALARAFPDEIFEGVVASIDSRVDPVTRAISVRAVVDNADHTLRPGMLMRIKLQKNPRQALVVPEETLVPRGDRNFVFVLNEQGDKTVAVMQPVTLGARRNGDVEITDGLKAGDKVVTHGTLRLQDGAAVTIAAIQKSGQSLADLLREQNKQDGK